MASLVWRPFVPLDANDDILDVKFIRNAHNKLPDRFAALTASELKVYGMVAHQPAVLLHTYAANELKENFHLKWWSRKEVKFTHLAAMDDSIIVGADNGNVYMSKGMGKLDILAKSINGLKQIAIEGNYILLLCASELLIMESQDVIMCIPLEEAQICNVLCMQSPVTIITDMIICIAGHDRWTVMSVDITERVHSVAGVYGSENEAISTMQFVVSHPDFIDLYVAAGRAVILQRFTMAMPMTMADAREVMVVDGAQCIGMAVFAGDTANVCPAVFAYSIGSDLQMRSSLLRITEKEGLLCDDLGVDACCNDSRLLDRVIDEAGLEAMIATGRGIYVYSGLAVRNSWIPHSFARSACFDFAEWFDLLSPFPPFSPGSPSALSPHYPPKSWSELRALCDNIKALDDCEDAKLSLLHYLFIASNQPAIAGRFARSFAVHPSAGFVDVSELDERRLLSRLGFAEAYRQFPGKLAELVGLLMDGEEDRSFLDYPFDHDTVDVVWSHLQCAALSGSERALSYFVLFSFHHSKYTELLAVVNSKTAFLETLPIKLRALVDNLALVTNVVPCSKAVVRSKTVARKPFVDPFILQKSKPSTPAKQQTHCAKKATREYSPMMAIHSPAISPPPSPKLKSPRLGRQPRIVTISTPRHHPALHPSRLKHNVIQQSSTESLRKRSRSQSPARPAGESRRASSVSPRRIGRGGATDGSLATPSESSEEPRTPKRVPRKSHSSPSASAKSPSATSESSRRTSPRRTPLKSSSYAQSPSGKRSRKKKGADGIPRVSLLDTEESPPASVTIRDPAIRHSPRLSRRK